MDHANLVSFYSPSDIAGNRASFGGIAIGGIAWNSGHHPKEHPTMDCRALLRKGLQMRETYASMCSPTKCCEALPEDHPSDHYHSSVLQNGKSESRFISLFHLTPIT